MILVLYEQMNEKLCYSSLLNAYRVLHTLQGFGEAATIQMGMTSASLGQ